MAHAARLGGLTDELVTLLTSESVKADALRLTAQKESVLRALRYHNYTRTNQFDVTNQLEGLDEKFRIYGQDSLADALKERLETLSNLETRWSPEILQLLLELSDRPVAHSRLESLDSLREEEPVEQPALKWKDLFAEDPLLRDEHIWRNVDFGADSSEEDGFEDNYSELSDSGTVQSSVDQEFYRHPEDYAVDTLTKDDFEELRNAQFWRKTPQVGGVKLETVKKSVTEMQAAREVLFMLSGYPTSLFEVNQTGSSTIEPSKSYNLKHTSYDTFHKLMESFATQGSALSVLRSWVEQTQSIPLLQVFQSSIQQRILGFENSLSKMQELFVAPKNDVVVSLLGINVKVELLARPLIRLSHIISVLKTEPYAYAFRYLELLYDETCVSQMAGDEQMYNFMGRMFFECFAVYLRPIRKWMDEGALGQHDKLFFVTDTSESMDLASIWQSRYKLRQTQNGVLHAPKFLHTATNRIFTAGKSVIVLKQLNQFSALQSIDQDSEPSLDFDSVCESGELGLAPFPELFGMAFDSWIHSKHNHAFFLLRRILFENCGLSDALDAFSNMFFLSEGATASAFTNTIFDKLDTLDPSWHDSFTLTELAQSTFGALPPFSPNRLRCKIRTLPRSYQDSSVCKRTIKVLSVIEMDYQLPWPVHMILLPAAKASYQRIFTFLVQVRRSTYLLSRQRIVKDMLTNTSSSSERALYFSLRSRLLWFNQTLYYYLTFLILEPASRRVHHDLKSAENIDVMIEVHSKYIKSIIDQTLLGSKLELIHRSVLKILDLGIKLEDAQALNALANEEASEQRQEMMDLSMASLGLHTPQRKGKPSFAASKSTRVKQPDTDSSSEDDHADNSYANISILSSKFGNANEEQSFVESMKTMRADFDRLVRFVISGLKGVARAGGKGEAKSWDILGEMLESGLGSDTPVYQ